MKKLLSLLLLLSICLPAAAQELFIMNEPASVLPKDGLALRSISHFYKEDGFTRFRQSFRFTYGISAKWELGMEFGGSNHNHPGLVSELFADGDLDHQHGPVDPDGGVVEEHNHPFKITGALIYSQYRFWTSDGPNTHLRAATYQIFSSNWTSHNFAEPNLYHRNAGFGGGFIFTWLRKRFAASARLGGIAPLGYYERDTERYFRSGNAVDYSLSLGYLTFPRKYKDYDNVNINLYAEFMGKWFQSAWLRDDYRWYPTTTFSETDTGAYLDVRPGIQAIFKSRFRVETAVALPFLGRSLSMEYPQVQINLQYLFFP